MSVALEVLSSPLPNFFRLLLILQLLQRAENVPVEFQTLLTEDKLHKSGLDRKRESVRIEEAVAIYYVSRSAYDTP